MTDTANDRVLDITERALLLRLARASLAQAAGAGRHLDDLLREVEPSTALLAPRGAFVTLHGPPETAGGRPALRGCIGRVESSRPLYRAVIEIAPLSGMHDPRFPRVTAAELPRLVIEVSALSPLRPVTGPEAFHPGRDGVEIELRGQRAVFLPQVAVEQGWTREQTLEQLCRKAGLHQEDWRSPEARLATFQAEVFSEGEPGMPATGGDLPSP